MHSNTSIRPEGLLRLRDILGQRATAKRPAVPALIPVSASTWWRGVKSGRYPKPVRISESTTAWRASDVLRLIDEAVAASGGAADQGGAP